MKWEVILRTFFSALAVVTIANPLFGQAYSDDFDADSTTAWTINPSGVTDTSTDFFFDYSSVGIPPAPNSNGGTTRGMKLQANLTSNMFGGFSVSPTGESFSGDYVLSYDMWQSYHSVPFTPANPPFAAGGGIQRGAGSGTTNLSYGGILTSGTVENSPGNADGIWFAATGDGNSSADYRVYSQERPASYRIPPQTAEDQHATHFAGTRNDAGSLYSDNFGSEAAPLVMQALFPNTAGEGNITAPGTLGFAWHQHAIRKIGDIITWSVDGIDLIELDSSNFSGASGGSNILFGHSDTNSGSPNVSNVDASALLFTLVDNIVVTAVPEPRTLTMLGCVFFLMVISQRSIRNTLDCRSPGEGGIVR